MSSEQQPINIENKPQQYKTPIYQLIRQIIVFLVTICIAFLSTFISILTNKINENLNHLENQFNQTQMLKVIN